jgi:hypothetical protein
VDYAFEPWLQAREERARERLRGQLIAICDVQVWWVLTHYLKLDRDEVKASLVEIIEKLLGPKPGARRRGTPAAKRSSAARERPAAKRSATEAKPRKRKQG